MGSQERAAVWENKAGPAVFSRTTKKSMTEEKKQTSGGEKDTNESSKTENTVVSENCVSRDAIEFLVGIDLTQYFNLRHICQEIFKIYALSLDLITKNLSKIEDPRGDQDHGMSM